MRLDYKRNVQLSSTHKGINIIEVFFLNFILFYFANNKPAQPLKSMTWPTFRVISAVEVKDASVPPLKQPHSPFYVSVHQELMIDYQTACKREKKNKTTQRTTWQDTQCLSAMHEGSPAEAVARLPEHEALTALPKANVNLYRRNGVGDVW